MHQAPCHRQEGFTLVEMVIAVAIISTLLGVAIAVPPAFLARARADAGITQAVDVFRSAREAAIAQRRNVVVRFISPDVIETARVEIPSGTTTRLRTVQLDNRMRFMLNAGLPDTPDRFGNASAVAFGPSSTRMFTSEGTFVDGNGDVLNGSLFLGIPGDAESARAITVFGATALVRTWRWNGRAWID